MLFCVGAVAMQVFGLWFSCFVDFLWFSVWQSGKCLFLLEEQHPAWQK
jgi:hypothetical protein